MNEELNQKIHEWRGLCWHDSKEITHFDRNSRWTPCSQCKWEGPNPGYTADPAAMLELIEAVKAKHGFKISCTPGSRSGWMCVIWDGSRVDQSEVDRTVPTIADTLPMAVALAVEKLIDSEGKR